MRLTFFIKYDIARHRTACNTERRRKNTGTCRRLNTRCTLETTHSKRSMLSTLGTQKGTHIKLSTRSTLSKRSTLSAPYSSLLSLTLRVIGLQAMIKQVKTAQVHVVHSMSVVRLVRIIRLIHVVGSVRIVHLERVVYSVHVVRSVLVSCYV